eukprot:GEZU01043453.1.p1 GENE.GEZU01043453.1~~GEZU01043453.1.p1  ORF type:complete len:210 (-),score=73.91 GEZU01043453.1:25-654(-)
MDEEEQTMFKVTIVGDSGVGKSCILMRFSEDDFNDKSKSTIGVDFKICDIDVGNEKVKLQIWDTAGQDRYKTFRDTYYRNTNGVMVVYDITSKVTYDAIKNKWIPEIESLAPKDISIMIIGNKSDCKDARAVQTATAKSFFETSYPHVKFMEVSAKDGNNIVNAFRTMAKDILAKKRGGSSGGGGVYGGEPIGDPSSGNNNERKGCALQ